jgi:TRAP-type C4-dicarboxylate transport system substrate-binding protein
MNRLVKWCAAVACAISTSAAAQVKWDLTSEYAHNSLIGTGNQFFVDKLKDKSSGQIVVTPHFGGSLGFKSREVLDAVGRGAVPMGDAPVGFWVGIEPIFQLPVLPFVVSSTKEALALYEIAKPAYAKALAKNNQYLVYAAPWPPNGIWSKRPLESAKSFSGLKIRTLDPVSTNTFKALNALPQQLAWADVVPMLATGGIEAVMTSADGGVSAKFWDHVSNYTAANVAWALSMATINKDAFDRLSDTQKKAFREAAAETEAHQWAAVDERVRSSYVEMRAKNVRITEAPPADMKEALVKAAEPAVRDWVAKVGPEGRSIIESFRKRTAGK